AGMPVPPLFVPVPPQAEKIVLEGDADSERHLVPPAVGLVEQWVEIHVGAPDVDRAAIGVAAVAIFQLAVEPVVPPIFAAGAEAEAVEPDLVAAHEGDCTLGSVHVDRDLVMAVTALGVEQESRAHEEPRAQAGIEI